MQLPEPASVERDRTPGPSASHLALLVDFDNAFPRPVENAAEMATAINRLLWCGLDLYRGVSLVDIRLYGGWLDEGVLTNRASAIHAAIGGMPTVFPLPHPYRAGLLRGQIQLVTRLVGIPGLEWRHTLRHRSGLPHVALSEKPFPIGCVHESNDCPVRLLQKLARRPARECHATGCHVTNRSAFRVPEQKMVDTMLCCDAWALSSSGSVVIVVSSDMDLLPAVATLGVSAPGRVALVRSSKDSAMEYEEELKDLRIAIVDWELA